MREKRKRRCLLLVFRSLHQQSVRSTASSTLATTFLVLFTPTHLSLLQAPHESHRPAWIRLTLRHSTPVRSSLAVSVPSPPSQLALPDRFGSSFEPGKTFGFFSQVPK